jgi:hypothetical protein
MAMGTAIIGRFLIPDPTSAAGVASASTAGAAGGGAETEVAGLVRRLLAGPVWNKHGTVLAWMETFDEDKKPHVMSWYPETDDEKAEAKRFFEIAMWRPWRTRQELQALLRQPGPWLIRQNFQEAYCFLCTTDEAVMLGTKDDFVFSYDVEKAVRLTSERALVLIPWLMDVGYGKWTGGPPYLEPVKPEDARTNFRSLRFPVT